MLSNVPVPIKTSPLIKFVLLKYCPSEAEAHADPDAAEIWSATQWLYAASPELAELPSEVSSTVAALPTEQFRRAVKR